MQPPATIMTDIHHYRLFVTVTSQQFGIHLTETRTIHSLDMNITDTSAGQFLYFLTAILHPPLIKEFALRRISNRFDRLFKAFLRTRVINRKNRFTISLTLKQREIIHTRLDSHTVYLLDYTTGLDIGFLFGQRTLSDDFLDFQSITGIRFIIEYAQCSRRQCCAGSIITRSRMRSVQLTQHFTQHFRKVVVIIDIWQEAFIARLIARPVRSLQIFHIELIIHLLPNMVENILTFSIRTIIKEGLKLNRSNFTALCLYFLHTFAAAKENILSILIRQQSTRAYIFQKNLG